MSLIDLPYIVSDRSHKSPISLNSSKPFIPHDKYRLPVGNFQQILKPLLPKIWKGAELISKFGLAKRAKIGNRSLFDLDCLADLVGPSSQTLAASRKRLRLSNYLYEKQVIYPQLFADVLHFIGSNAKVLDPLLAEVQLNNLGRRTLTGVFNHSEFKKAIGENFSAFDLQTK